MYTLLEVIHMKLHDNLRKAREYLGLSQLKVSEVTGISNTTISNYERGISSPDPDNLLLLAKIYNVTVDSLLGNTTESIAKKPIRIPVLGVIPAGIPIEAIENIVDYEELHPDALKGNRIFFGLRVKGDSMSPEIQNGSTVIVRQQAACDSGDVCVVMVDGQDATLKRVRLDPDGIYLIPANSGYTTEFYSNEKIKKLPVRILGVVYEVRFSYKKI